MFSIVLIILYMYVWYE